MSTCVLVLPLSVNAAVRATETILIPAGETIDDNLYAGGERITIDGTVAGDLVAGASFVTVNGTIAGDLIVGAAEVRINGTVAGNVRGAANTIEISGSVGRNITAAAAIVTVTSTGSVGWGVTAAAADVTVDGQVGGSVIAAAGTVIVNGTVGGSVDIDVGRDGAVMLGEGAVIGKDFTYRTDTTFEVPAGASIGGQVRQLESRIDRIWDRIWPGAVAFTSAAALFTKVISLFGLFVTGLVLVSLFGRWVRGFLPGLSLSSGVSWGWGLGAVVLTPIVFFILLLTFIGIPLAFILMSCYLIALYVGHVVVGTWIGWRLLGHGKSGQERNTISLIGAMVLGTLIFSIVSALPIVGWIVGLSASAWFLGSLIVRLHQRT